MAGDWIKLHRKILDSPIFSHAGLFHLWTYCLLRASWRDGKWLVPRTLQEVPVPRGSFVTGRASLHATLYPKRDADGRLIVREQKPPCPRTLWRWLDSLRVMGCVDLKNVSNRCTVVTVCNYSTYQDVDDAPCPADVPLVSRSCPADVPLMSTVEEDKKVRKEEEEDARAPARPERPTLEQVEAYCRERNNAVDAKAWFDHYQSNGWRVGRNPMKDWRAAVRTWERNESKFNGTGKSNGKHVPTTRELLGDFADVSGRVNFR